MIEQKLKALTQSDVYPFHMPGHKRQLSGFFPYELDITEIEEKLSGEMQMEFILRRSSMQHRCISHGRRIIS